MLDMNQKIVDPSIKNTEIVSNGSAGTDSHIDKSTNADQLDLGVGNTRLPPNCKGRLVYWFFTYNNYTEDIVDMILSTFQKICKRYVFQTEVGKDGTPHLQGTIQLWKQMRWSEFGLPKAIHWEKVKDVKSAFLYCAKDDTFAGRRWVYPENLIQTIIAGEKKNMELRVIEKLRPWQQSVLDSLQEMPDDRSINWIYDEQGCAGKTVFAKYLVWKHRAIVATGGGNKDIACLLAILVEAGRDLNDRTSFIFNFPRSTEGISYKAIESVKDGLMTSVKYASSTLVFNCPHVWCFSNEMPNLDKLSADRWRLWTIKDDLLVSLNGTDSGSESPEVEEVRELLRDPSEHGLNVVRTCIEHGQISSSDISQVSLEDDPPDNILVSSEEIDNFYPIGKYFEEKRLAFEWCALNCNAKLQQHRRNCRVNEFPGGS